MALAAGKKLAALKAAEEAKALKELASAEAERAAAATAAQPATDALARATEVASGAEAEKASAIAAAKEAAHRMHPVSVLISLKTQRLYVRQRFEPVLESPVTIQDPDQPIGTHIFTALGYADGGNAVTWSAVTLARRAEDDGRGAEIGGGPRRRSSLPPPPPSDVGAATAALERVTIPPEVLARISEFVWPGSSLIISDEEMHKETGQATDFVVLISGEPQGGIKKRPKQPNYFDFYDYYDPYYAYERRGRYRYRAPSFGWW
jgi:hypothetical protein